MIKKILTWSQGRHTAFAAFFAIMGTVMAWYHRLDASYIALIGAIQSFVLAHSVKEDYFKKDSKDDKSDKAPQ